MPNPHAQHTIRTLCLTTGSRGHCLTFAGGGRDLLIDDPTDPNDPPLALFFPRWEDAGAAYREAILASDRLALIARGEKA